MKKFMMFSLLMGSLFASSIVANVEGMVCDFCARGLEKVFSKQDEVASIKVSLEKSIVEIYFKEGKALDDKTITKLILGNGISVNSIDRNDSK
ncbi:MAG: Unknown protein [uncultured Campylobacterales bacterium]|uniref:HMA domain-containing protein n=1 Tax=uncultured Campylobacterales bacterium TaxID=352960 RepID=A0A6S6SJ34_9BACT|nr:MAG: Unknown protein [uncultured Campylobacterales bacterium]